MLGIFIPTRFEATLLLKKLKHRKKTRLGRAIVHRGMLGDKALCVCILGMGQRSGNVCREIFEKMDFERIILAGFCGALDPALHRGDALCVSGDRYQEKIYTSLEPISTVGDKHQYWKASGCPAVDMEAAWVALACRSAHVPLTILRVVSDDATDPLPMHVLKYGYDAVKAKETPIKMTRHLIRKPSHIKTVVGYVKGIKPVQNRLLKELLNEIAR